MEDILGIIESISNINNSLVIVVANESKMSEEDNSKYLNFKEKVIQKIYNVDHYSCTAINEILNNSINSLNVDENLKQNISLATLDIFNSHNINNLRTLEKGLNFVKLLMKHINFLELTNNEIFQLITISLAIVIEKIEKNYCKKKQEQKENEKNLNLLQSILENQGKELPYYIINNYLKEPALFSGKSTLIEFLINIYDDLNLDENFQAINKLYADLHTIREKNEDILTFYLPEDKLKERINTFYRDYVLKTNESIDVHNWFKQLNEFYYYAEIIGMQNIFKDKEINEAMDNYLKNLEIKEGLFYLLDRHVPLEIKSDKMKKINTILNNKITNKYYNSCIDKILNETKEGIFEIKNLDTLYSLFSENEFEGKNQIIEKITKNSYFIPDLNYELNEDKWRWTHSIWSKAQSYRTFRDNRFENVISILLKKATKLGKYRIKSLNSQYVIILEEINKK